MAALRQHQTNDERDTEPTIARAGVHEGHDCRQECQSGHRAVISTPLAQHKAAGRDRRGQQQLETSPHRSSASAAGVTTLSRRRPTAA